MTSESGDVDVIQTSDVRRLATMRTTLLASTGWGRWRAFRARGFRAGGVEEGDVVTQSEDEGVGAGALIRGGDGGGGGGVGSGCNNTKDEHLLLNLLFKKKNPG